MRRRASTGVRAARATCANSRYPIDWSEGSEGSKPRSSKRSTSAWSPVATNPAARDSRRRVEPPQERPDVEPRAAYDDGQTPASPDRLDRGCGVVTEAGGLISVVGVHDVDEVMDDRSARLGSRLPGRRVHAAIDLPRVGADHFDRYLVSERHRHSGLADARGPADHDNGDLRVLAHRPQCISPNSSRFTRDAPRQCTDT